MSWESVLGRGSASAGGWYPLPCEGLGLGGDKARKDKLVSVLERGCRSAPARGHRCSGSQAFRLLLPLHHGPLGLGPSGPVWNWTRGVRRPPAGSQQSLGLLGLHRCQPIPQSQRLPGGLRMSHRLYSLENPEPCRPSVSRDTNAHTR